MEKVIEIKLNGKFHQYLLLSEARLIYLWLKDGYIVEAKLEEVTKERFKTLFN